MERAVRVVQTRLLSPSVRSLSLAIADLDGSPFTFVAGQWINLYVPTAEGVEKRAYSIASAPTDELVELAVTQVAEGVVSPLLHDLPDGAALTCDGPHGFFTRDGSLRGTPALFVATGTGLCPLRSMLREVLREPEHPPITLLFGVRTQADILWRDELAAWAADDSRFALEVTLSRPDGGWTGRTGYVQAHVQQLAERLGDPHVFICGLSRMVAEVRAVCKTDLGYDRRRIHSERYD
jgi:NAD(P)H-flavin reductase